MWDVRACRSCLSIDGKLEKVGEASKRIYQAVTGLEIVAGDGYPAFFCHECRSQIRRCLQFRRRARRAFFVLKEIMTIQKKVMFKDIMKVDRKKTNLESAYSTNMVNSALYEFTSREDQDNKDVQKVEPKEEPCMDLQPILKVESSNKSLYTLEISFNETKLKKIKQDGEEPKKGGEVKKVNLLEVGERGKPVTVVDIKPDNWREIEEELAAQSIKKEEEQLNDDTPMDNDSDYAITDPSFVVPEDIDMDDVFKGLKSDEESDYSLPELEFPKPKTKKEKKKEKAKKEKLRPQLRLPVKKLNLLAKALCSCQIRLLSSKEQVERFNAKLLDPSFAKALYKCAVCLQKDFNNLQQLLYHIQTTHNEEEKNPYLCTICKRKFKTEESLLIHSTQWHWYEYTCNICGKVYDTTNEIVECFTRHQTSKSKCLVNFNFLRWPVCSKTMYRTMEKFTGPVKTSLMCQDCNIGFTKEKLLNEHLSQHIAPENTTEYFTCDICKIHFTKYENLVKHMEWWHLYIYTCKKCQDTFMNRHQIYFHEKQNICQLRVTEGCLCQHCGQKITNLRGFQKHLMAKHMKESFQSICNMCGNSFRNTFKLYEHQLQEHYYVRINNHDLGDPRYVCTECDVFFTSEEAYYNHVAKFSHDAIKDIPNACTICKKIFKSECEQEVHNVLYHQFNFNVFPRPCSYCDGTLVTRLDYKNHMNTAHAGLMDLPQIRCELCEICGKTVQKNFGGMTAHVNKYHNENSSYISCRYCNETFKTHTAVVSHTISLHTIKPYLCAVCPSRYSNRCALRDHILKIHAPVMPYQCSSCDRRFAHLDYLHQHSSKIHGIPAKTPSAYLSRKAKPLRRIVIYPHMKLDCTLVDREYIDKSEIQTCDYMDDNIRPLENYLDHLVFDSSSDEVYVERNPWKIKSMRRQLKGKVKTKKGNVDAQIEEEARKIELALDDSEADANNEWENMDFANVNEDINQSVNEGVDEGLDEVKTEVFEFENKGETARRVVGLIDTPKGKNIGFIANKIKSDSLVKNEDEVFIKQENIVTGQADTIIIGRQRNFNTRTAHNKEPKGLDLIGKAKTRKRGIVVEKDEVLIATQSVGNKGQNKHDILADSNKPQALTGKVRQRKVGSVGDKVRVETVKTYTSPKKRKIMVDNTSYSDIGENINVNTNKTKKVNTSLGLIDDMFASNEVTDVHSTLNEVKVEDVASNFNTSVPLADNTNTGNVTSNKVRGINVVFNLKAGKIEGVVVNTNQSKVKELVDESQSYFRSTSYVKEEESHKAYTNDQILVAGTNEENNDEMDNTNYLVEGANEESFTDVKEGYEGEVDNSNPIEESILSTNEGILEESDGRIEMNADEVENYEIMEMDGCEYVMIGGTLYKIERE